MKSLKEANQLFGNHEFEAALKAYLQLSEEVPPALKESINHNIVICEKKLSLKKAENTTENLENSSIKEIHQENANTAGLQIQPNKINGKTILFVDYTLPLYDKYAGSRTNYMYLRLLLKLGTKVIYYPLDESTEEPYNSELIQMGCELLRPKSNSETFKSWLSKNEHRVNIAFLNKPEPALKTLDDLSNYNHIKIIYQCHDLHHKRLEKQYELTNAQEYLIDAINSQKIEEQVMQASNTILTFNWEEKEIILNKFPEKNVECVPLYLYDKEKLKHSKKSRSGLLFVGGFDHSPNEDAINWFLSDIYPLLSDEVPGIHINIIGSNPPKKLLKLADSLSGVKFLGGVSDEKLHALYLSSRIAVIPLRFGAGTKGKTIEALSYGIPLVSTSIGLEGISGVEKVCEPCDDTESFKNKIKQIYTNAEKSQKQEITGLELIKDNFTYENAANKIERILLKDCKASAVGDLRGTSVNVLAFYLPQFHPIKENDIWWGKGFTEWRNTCKAKPLFNSHYQPHIPADLGFYDLRLNETREEQADLAREYGITGFIYYHYWFNGKRVLEQPVESLINSSKPSFPFCLCWANENWTRTWDGEEENILIEQNYGEKDDLLHIKALVNYFNDYRYIKIEGRPLLLVYRTENMPNPKTTSQIWRNYCRSTGVGEIYLVRVESGDKCNPKDIGFDAAMEFAPDWEELGKQVTHIDAETNGKKEFIEIPYEVQNSHFIRSYDTLKKNMISKKQKKYAQFKCITPSWDNSPRKNKDAIILTGSTPQKFKEWASETINLIYDAPLYSTRLLIVNAWNEWAEGNHLEPCQKWGKGYLKALKEALDEGKKRYTNKISNFGVSKAENYSSKMIRGSKEKKILSQLDKSKSPSPVIVSIDTLLDAGSDLSIIGWAKAKDVNNDINTKTYVMIEYESGLKELYSSHRIKRPEITNYFNDGNDYTLTGFSTYFYKAGKPSKCTIVIEHYGAFYWQAVDCD